MVGAVITGFIVGVIARALTPGDVFRDMSGPTSWLVSIVVGLVGSLLGYLVFTGGLGIGDAECSTSAASSAPSSARSSSCC